MNIPTLQEFHEQQTYQMIVQEFYELSRYDPNIQACYTHWRKKDLTLEQALTLAVEELSRHCYNLTKKIPPESFTQYSCFGGSCIDYIAWVNDSPEYTPSLKMKLLAEYSRILTKLVMTHLDYLTDIKIKIEVSEESLKAI
jgi:hypothetical protein